MLIKIRYPNTVTVSFVLIGRLALLMMQLFYFRWFKLCWMGLITYLRWVTSIVLYTFSLLTNDTLISL